MTSLRDRVEALSPEQKAKCDQMLLENKGLAGWAIKKYGWMATDIPYDDLFSICLETIWRSAMTYDSSRSTFGTYAGSNLKWTFHTLYNRDKGSGGLRFAPFGYRALSLEYDLEEEIEITDSQAEHELSDVIEIADLEHLLSRCSERSREMIKMRIDGYTLAEVGEAFGITRERVRQIIRRSYEKDIAAA